MEDGSSFSSFLSYWVGGGFIATLTGASMGRLMHHTMEVKKHKRSFFSLELLWEIPIALGMAMIAYGVSDYFGLSQAATVGVAAVMGHLGPKSAEALLDRYLDKTKDK